MTNTIFDSYRDEEARDVVIEDLIFDVQMGIKALMKSKGVTQADLAALLNVSEARVSQLLGLKGSNMTLGTLGKVGHALGALPCVEFVLNDDCADRCRTFTSAGKAKGSEPIKFSQVVKKLATQKDRVWHREYHANLNGHPRVLAA